MKVAASSVLVFASLLGNLSAFTPPSIRHQTKLKNDAGINGIALSAHRSTDTNEGSTVLNRRGMLRLVSAMPFLKLLSPESSSATVASASDTSDKYAPKFVQTYEDFTQSAEGWQYKDVKVGSGDVTIQKGDRVVFDWSGYTIGYFGRPFEAKGGPQGGAFDKDIDYSRTIIGSNTVIPGLEQALLTMKPGGVRQVIVPYGELSYPPTDLEHQVVGPKPTTFSGQRALNFVLENPRVDRTLLFNVKLIRVDKASGNGKFIRG